METILKGRELVEKVKSLKKVKTDTETWDIYFVDVVKNEKWVKGYPNSDLHGGGAPLLRKIDKFPWD